MRATLRACNFLRVPTTAPEMRVADVKFNVIRMNVTVDDASTQGVSVVFFPKLSIAGSTCGNLFAQPPLLGRAIVSLQTLALKTRACTTSMASWAARSRQQGEILYERWLTSGTRFAPAHMSVECSRPPGAHCKQPQPHGGGEWRDARRVRE